MYRTQNLQQGRGHRRDTGGTVVVPGRTVCMEGLGSEKEKHF